MGRGKGTGRNKWRDRGRDKCRTKGMGRDKHRTKGRREHRARSARTKGRARTNRGRRGGRGKERGRGRKREWLWRNMMPPSWGFRKSDNTCYHSSQMGWQISICLPIEGKWCRSSLRCRCRMH